MIACTSRPLASPWRPDDLTCLRTPSWNRSGTVFIHIWFNSNFQYVVNSFFFFFYRMMWVASSPTAWSCACLWCRTRSSEMRSCECWSSYTWIWRNLILLMSARYVCSIKLSASFSKLDCTYALTNFVWDLHIFVMQIYSENFTSCYSPCPSIH